MVFHGAVLLALFIQICTAYESGDLPIENPDLPFGDIIGLGNFEDRNAVVDKRRIWPGGIIPYQKDQGLPQRVQTMLVKAMEHYKKETCIQFVPRGDEKDFVRIFPGQGCYSMVGRAGGSQGLSLGVGCGYLGTVLHELGHAVGFYHEQNRSDRDDFINIFWDNIREGMASQFSKLKPEDNQLLTSFDYESVMLYGSYTFSKDRKRLMTMEGKNNTPLKDVMDKHSLSKMDILRIKKLYKCDVEIGFHS